MSSKNGGRSRKRKSGVGVLEKAADAGAALAGGPVQVWQTAREGTQQIADVLPDTMGLGRVREFIHRHPLASAGAALVVGYVVFGNALPFIGAGIRLVGGRR